MKDRLLKYKIELMNGLNMSNFCEKKNYKDY